MIYRVYFGLDKEPNEKDLAVETNDKANAESVWNQLIYLNFNNAYILQGE